MVAIVSQIESMLGMVGSRHNHFAYFFSDESTIYDWNKNFMSHTDSKKR